MKSQVLMKTIAGFLMMAASVFAATAPDQFSTPDDPVAVPTRKNSGRSTPEALDVLFIGNSYSASAGSQPAFLEVFMNSRAKKCRTLFYSRAGETLEGFDIRNAGDERLTYYEGQAFQRLKTDDERTAFKAKIATDRAGMRGKLSEAIAKGPWDVVVLQVWTDAQMSKEMEFQKHVSELSKLIRANSPDARIILYMVWSSQNDPQKQGVIEASVLEAARTNKLEVAPAGLALWKVLPARTDWKMFRSATDSHPGYDGGYLIACSIFAAITRESPLGLPNEFRLPESYDFPVPVKTPDRAQRIKELGPGPDYPFSIDPEKAKLIQQAAWDTYKETSERLAAKPAQ